MKIWLAYVNYPITTAVYLRRALENMGHSIFSIGPRLPEEAIELWGLQNMNLPLTPQDIDTSFEPDMAAISASTPMEHSPDLYLWVESVNGYRPQNLHSLPCPKACWLIDTHYHRAAALETARHFDYVFIAQLIDLEYFRSELPHVCWLPLACDPGVHGRQFIEKKYDVTFVGSMNSRRDTLLCHLEKNFNVHRERSFWTDMARTFSASRIVLNDASFDDLNMRFFEALCSGSLLLSNPTADSGQDILFHKDEEYACHHDYDITDTVNRYLADDLMRERVARQGRQCVLAAHTYRHRAEDLLDVVTGKKHDTWSPEQLRTFSLQRHQLNPDQAPALPSRIRSVISTRFRSNWPTWQMVHEWEDIISKLLATPISPLGKSTMLPDPEHPPRNFDLIFIQLAGELKYYAHNHQLIPVVMDLFESDFDVFLRNAPHFHLVFVCNLQPFQKLSPLLPNLRYLPFTLADQYFGQQLPEKDIDIIHYGRRNPVLEQFMARFLEAHPETHYVTTEAFNEEKIVRIYSNRIGEIGVSDSRRTFINMLNRARISLVSTVGIDGCNTGNIDPVSPRFLESMASGCYLVGRFPDNDEFRQTGIGSLCYRADSYQQFHQTVHSLLAGNKAPPDYTSILKDRLTSTLPARILKELNDHRTTPAVEEVMQSTRPAVELANRLNALRREADSIPPADFFSIYMTLCDVIASCREFHNLDLSHFYSLMLENQPSERTLLITALELANKGNMTAALNVALRLMQLDKDNPNAANLHADLLRRSGQRDAARMECHDLLGKWPDFPGFDAVLDLCDVDEALPLPREHYHLLHMTHCCLKPRRYLEIGISNGKSLALAQNGTSVIGVDPMTAETGSMMFHSPASAPELFKMTSNEFFQKECMGRAWNGNTFDMAFIDGLHLFEQALMDFIHLEYLSKPDSIIFIHDCLPVSIKGAERDRTTMVWTGDVWKLILCLKQLRPDLEIVTFPVRPSGLAMVRRLDPASRLLSNQFDAIANHFLGSKLPEPMSERFRLLNVTDVPYEKVLSDISKQQGTWQDTASPS